MMDEMDRACRCYRTNKRRPKSQKTCKEALYAVTDDDNNCPIILPSMNFSISVYTSSRKTTRNNTGKGEMPL